MTLPAGLSEMCFIETNEAVLVVLCVPLLSWPYFSILCNSYLSSYHFFHETLHMTKIVSIINFKGRVGKLTLPHEPVLFHILHLTHYCAVSFFQTLLKI